MLLRVVSADAMCGETRGQLGVYKRCLDEIVYIVAREKVSCDVHRRKSNSCYLAFVCQDHYAKTLVSTVRIALKGSGDIQCILTRSLPLTSQ